MTTLQVLTKGAQKVWEKVKTIRNATELFQTFGTMNRYGEMAEKLAGGTKVCKVHLLKFFNTNPN